MDIRPKLRPVHPQPLVSDGQPFLYLQDQQISEKGFCIHRALAPVLFFCDGSHNLDELRALLLGRVGIQLSKSDLEYLIDQLDDALLLENERSRAAYEEATRAFRSAPFRSPALAGHGYPADPLELDAMLNGYFAATAHDTIPQVPSAIRGLITPHIDYQRGGRIYARVWSRAVAAVQEADLVIILGTDHNGGAGRITLTRQSYATPFGVLPTEHSLVDELAGRLGGASAFGEELNHLHEHSIELAAVWLHYLMEKRAVFPPVLPILTGSFFPFVSGEADIENESALVQAVDFLQGVLCDRRTLIVAAGDLAHVGPAFDGPEAIDKAGRSELLAHDKEMMERICAGEAQGFLGILEQEKDERNVCGLPPIYLMLRALGETRGTLLGYDQCPADAEKRSFVSICGIVLE